MTKSLILRLLGPVLAMAALLFPAPLLAEVDVSFHSFNGSLFGNRFPHTFVVLQGRLDTGETVNENWGFTAKTISPAILAGPVAHTVYSEKAKYIRTTNRHFTITVPDETYHRMKAEMVAWRDAPGRYYDLDTRNCIHFVGKMAQLAGLKIEFPRELLRKPKAWLERISQINPGLRAKPVA